jgi:hypothetical protein
VIVFHRVSAAPQQPSGVAPENLLALLRGKEISMMLHKIDAGAKVVLRI